MPPLHPDPQTMFVVLDWIEAHCVIPDGFRAGQPFTLYDEQVRYLSAFYLVRGDAHWQPDAPVLAPAFVYARGIVVAPQKWGKNPLGAAHICVEAEGPVLFAGWAGKDEGYVCEDYGCRCGWQYAYQLGEPKGMPWPTPLIQVTAFSEDQTANTWKALRPMIEKGPLADLIPYTGESVIRLRNAGDEAEIQTVTSSAKSRLGARTTFVLQDQLETWTAANGMDDVADTQYRNLAGIGGRASLLANAWDPTQHSIAQREWELDADDIYRQATWAPEGLTFADPDGRRRIFEAVYPTDIRRENGGHVDLDSIEAEAAKIMEHDPPQARRWFGNERDVQGQGKAFDIAVWDRRRSPVPVEIADGATIVIGIDGSVRWDHFPVVATDVATGYQWPLRIWVPNGPGNEVPMGDVTDVLAGAVERWNVWRIEGDPPYIETWLAKWAGLWGHDVVTAFDTRQPKQTAYAIRAWKEAMTRGELSHCAKSHPWCALFSQHVGNAIRRDTPMRDDEGPLWTIEKDRPMSPNKIDSAMAAILSWDARLRALAAGVLLEETVSAYDVDEPVSVLA